MKKLNEILYKTGIKVLIGSTDIEIQSVCFDSRQVNSGSLFVAVKGTTSDGHLFIDQAIRNGAIAIVCEDIPTEKVADITYVKVINSSHALGVIASNFYDNPSSKLKLIGITGTNGKTTFVTLLFNLFRQLGYHVGMLSTVKNMIDDEEIAATHTTPDAIELNLMLRKM
ncbi:MAG TPA: Mur ligase domain-containing protein, partial [Bacteroidales bacterium]|nr:Mur ligase domain-containing protein [Bacteroidales bacterium]